MSVIILKKKGDSAGVSLFYFYMIVYEMTL